MAARIFLRPRAAAAIAAAGAGTSILLTRPIYAESQDSEAISARKPIYDDLSPPSLSPPSPSEPRSSPTPTSRLSQQVKAARLFLHSQAAKTEEATNALLAKTFALERDFTGTLASLAPPLSSGERVLPGLIYVLVSAMGASILTRNRNLLLRASAPVAVGVGAGYYFIPVTMGNVGALVWEVESRYPAVAEAHVRVKERVDRFVSTGLEHSRMGLGMAEEKVGEVRRRVEEWVAKGK